MKKIGWLIVLSAFFSFLVGEVIPQHHNTQTELHESIVQVLDFEDSGEPDFKGNNL